MIRDLAREHTSFTNIRTATKCKLHALSRAHITHDNTIKRISDLVKFYEKQIRSIENEFKKLVEADEETSSRIKKIETVK